MADPASPSNSQTAPTIAAPSSSTGDKPSGLPGPSSPGVYQRTGPSITVPRPSTPAPGAKLENVTLPTTKPPPQSPGLKPSRPGIAANSAMVSRGAYLARLGDCIACHTAKGGTPFAGGLAIGSPIGTIYSTNITPDKEHGIGGWSYEDFARLMRTGQTKSGYTVYPAMPYPSYSRITDDDMKALYAYFQHGVSPDGQKNRENGITWPLSVRWPLRLWRMAFAPNTAPFVAAPNTDAEVSRGAYLVEGLGHCGSCHTPRAITMQEKALTSSDGAIYLSGGGAIDGWIAPSLRNEWGGGLAQWSEAEIIQFLKTGRTNNTASFGAMNDVVVDSTQYFSDSDLSAVAKYLKSLVPYAPNSTAYRYDPKAAQALYAGRPQDAGAGLYIDRCAACHRSNGTGYGRAFPALAGNPILQTQDPTSAIHIILSGGSQPATREAPSSLSMAPYARLLNDEQVAQVVTFIQSSWGNSGGKATAADVARIRKVANPIESPGLAPMQRELRHDAPGNGAGNAASGTRPGE